MPGLQRRSWAPLVLTYGATLANVLVRYRTACPCQHQNQAALEGPLETHDINCARHSACTCGFALFISLLYCKPHIHRTS